MPITSSIPILGAPDYRNWFSTFRTLCDVEKNQIFVREIVPCLSDYCEGISLSKIRDENPWLVEFCDPQSQYETVIQELDENPNRTTLILADFVKHIAGTTIAVAWQKNMKTFVQKVE